MPKVSDVVPSNVAVSQEGYLGGPKVRFPAQESPAMRSVAQSLAKKEDDDFDKRVKEFEERLSSEAGEEPQENKDTNFFDFILSRSELTDNEKVEARKRAEGLKQTIKQIGGGFTDIINEAGNAAVDFTNFLEKHARDLQEGDEGLVPDNTNRKWLYEYLPENKPVTDREKSERFAARMLGTFLPAVGVAAKVSKGGAMATLATGSAIDAVIDFALFDPREERLANIIQKYPELQNPITEYLAADPEDTNLEGRFKNVIEGQFANGVVGTGMFLMAKAYKRARMARLASKEAGLLEAGSEAATTAMKTTPEAAGEAAPAAAKATGAAEGVPAAAGKPAPEAKKVLTELKAKMEAGDLSPQDSELLLAKIKEEKGRNPKLFDAEGPLARYDSEALKKAKTVEEVGTAIGLNITRPMTDDDILKLVDTLSKNPDVAKFSPDVIGEIPNPETFAAGRQLAIKNPKSVLQMRPGDVFNSEQQAAAIILERTAFKELENLAGEISEGSIKAKADFPAALKNWYRISNLNESAGSEAGRAFQVRRYGEKLKPLNEKQMAQHLSEVLKIQGPELDDGVEAALTVLSRNPKEAKEMLREAMKEATISEKRWSRILREVQVNGLLSSPKTSSGIIVSNVVMGTNDVIERGIARLLTKEEKGIVSGELGAFLRGGSSELVTQIKAHWAATIDSLKLTAIQTSTGQFGKLVDRWNAFGKAKSSFDIQNTRFSGEPAISGTKSLDALGGFIRLPTTAIRVGDDFAKSIRYRAEVHALAWRDTVEKGLAGDGARKHYEALTRLPSADLKVKYSRIHEEGIRAANQLTFSEGSPTILEGMEQIIKTAGVDNFGTPVLRWFLPFSGVEFRMAKYALDRTPLALFSQNFKNALNAGGAQAAMAKAKIAYGTSLLGVGAALGYSGLITGSGPQNRDAAKIQRDLGISPYSIRVGDQYVSFKGSEGITQLMGMGADLAAMQQYIASDADLYQDWYDLMIGVAMVASEVVSPEMFAQESGRLIDVLEGRADSKELLGRLSGTFVPYGNLARDITRMQEGEPVRETKANLESAMPILERMVNEFKARIPGLSEDLPPVLNIFGDPVLPLQGLGPDLMSPVYMARPAKHKVVLEEFQRLGVAGPLMAPTPDPSTSHLRVALPQRTISIARGSAKLDPKQYHRYVQLSAGIDLENNPFGATLAEKLTEMIQDEYPGLPEGSDESKRVAIKQIINAYRKLAQVQLIEEFPELNIKMEGSRMNYIQQRLGGEIVDPKDFEREYE